MQIEPKFPKLETGNECEGRMILGDHGERLGGIFREVDWIDVGTVRVSYKPKITGYRVEFWADPDPAFYERDTPTLDRIFDTLAEATEAAKKFYWRY